MTTHKPIVPVDTGYFLEDEVGFLSAFIPEERTNLILNPTMVDNDDNNIPDGYNYVTPTGILTKHETSPFGRHAYSLVAANDTDFIQAPTDSVIINGSHVASVWVRSQNGTRFRIIIRGVDVDTNDSVMYTSGVYSIATATWEQVSYIFNPSQLGNLNGIGITSVEIRWEETNPISAQYVDVAGFQLESGEYATSFIHGYAGEGYTWNGPAMNSSSTRSKDAVCGGRKVNLHDYGFRITSVSGLGIPEDFDINTTPRAFGLGSVFNCRSIETREITIEGVLYGCSFKDLLSKRNKLGFAVFDINKMRCFEWQPSICDESCPCVRFTGLLESGMQFGFNSLYGEEIELTFINTEIGIESCDLTCADLSTETVSNETGILGITTEGDIADIPMIPTFSGTVPLIHSIAFSEYTNRLYASITELVGIGTPNYWIVEWDGTQWRKIIRNFNGPVKKLYAYGQHLYGGMQHPAYSQGFASGGWTGSSNGGNLTLSGYMLRADLAAKNVVSVTIFPVTNVQNKDGVLVGPSITSFAETGFGDMYVGGNFAPIAATNEPDLAFFNVTSGGFAPHGLTEYFNFGTFPGTGNLGGILDMIYIKEKQQLWFGGDFNVNVNSGPTTIAQGYYGYSFVEGRILNKLPEGIFPYPTSKLPSDIGEVWAIEYYHGRVILGGRIRDFAIGNINYTYFTSVSGIAWVDDAGLPRPFNNDVGLGNSIPSTQPVVTSLFICHDVLHITGNINSYGTYNRANVWFGGSPIFRGELCGNAIFYSVGLAEGGDISIPPISAGSGSDCYVEMGLCANGILGLDTIFTNSSGGGGANSELKVPVKTNVYICENYLSVNPKVYIKGPGILSSIRNITNGTIVYLNYTFTNLSTQLDSIEILEIDSTQQPVKVVSNIFGDISHKVLSGSSNLILEPGDNNIIIDFELGSTTENTQAWICWHNTALSAEALQMGCI